MFDYCMGDIYVEIIRRSVLNILMNLVSNFNTNTFCPQFNAAL